MNTLPDSVQPGDIISSEMMTEILKQLDILNKALQKGSENVPAVIGLRLVDARAQILQPARKLAMGFVIDIYGASINPVLTSNANLIVLNQSPTADQLVAPNTSVNLVVSQTGGGNGPGPVNPPTITGTETVDGNSSTSFAVDTTMVIVGTNFSVFAAENQVTFDGVNAIVTGVPADPTQRLTVIIPQGIPGAPVNPGDSSKPGVVLSVKTTAQTPVTTAITVTAPIPDMPTIGSVDPRVEFEEGSITVTGANYTSSTEVFINDVSAPITSQSPTQLNVTVPNFKDILPGAPITVPVVVKNPGMDGVPYLGNFQVVGIPDES